MAQLNVKVTGAPDGSAQPVTLDVVQQGSESVPFVIFPTTRLTDGSGWVNFINLQPGQKIGPLLAAASSQKAVTPANQPVLFDGSADVTIELAYAPFKQPLPRVPSREEVCNGLTCQQGRIVHSLVYGDMPWWGACWAWLTQADRAHIAPQLMSPQGDIPADTICLIERPSGVPLYDEPNQFYSPDKFGPLEMSDDAFAALIEETLGYRFDACWVFLGGDDGANGYPIAVAQVQALAPVMGELNKSTLYLPGWDGVWHVPEGGGGTGYSREMLASFAAEARAAGAIYVGVEHGTGYLIAGKGAGDYAPGGVMDGYDVILGEFDDGRFDDSVWQILGRMVRPYVRPADEPGPDDPAPPFDLAQPSARGPYFYRIFEYHIYDGVRGQSPAAIAADRAKFQAMAPTARIC